MIYSNLPVIRHALNDDLSLILARMPKTGFVANEFIAAFASLNPIGHAYADRSSKNYRDFHCWVSRHYLLDLERKGILSRPADKPTKKTNTWSGRPTRNALWFVV